MSPVSQIKATYQGPANACGTSYRPGEQYLLNVKKTDSYWYIIGGWPRGTRRGYPGEKEFLLEWQPLPNV